MPDLRLPDVSEFQPDVNWQQVNAANGGAAIIRASYGLGFPKQGNPDQAWYGGARRAAFWSAGGKVLGIYHYLTASQDPVAQARFLCSILGSLRPGEFAIVDHEEGDGDQLARANAFLDYTDAHLTYPGHHGTWHYSGAAFYHAHNLMPVANSNRHTWVAAYGQGEPNDVPHTLWQYTSAENWPGVGACDSSIFHGSVADLAARVWTPPPARIPAPAPVQRPAPVPVPQEAGMARLIQVTGDPAIYSTDGVSRSWVQNPQAELELRSIGLYGDGAVHQVSPATLASLPLAGPSPV
jgi:GH25 family lysozyme M1 (1,4-beta-N-acetylmuramidase)